MFHLPSLCFRSVTRGVCSFSSVRFVAREGFAPSGWSPPARCRFNPVLLVSILACHLCTLHAPQSGFIDGPCVTALSREIEMPFCSLPASSYGIFMYCFYFPCSPRRTSLGLPPGGCAIRPAGVCFGFCFRLHIFWFLCLVPVDLRRFALSLGDCAPRCLDIASEFWHGRSLVVRCCHTPARSTLLLWLSVF